MTAQRKTADAPASILLIHHNRNGLAARKSVLEELGHTVTSIGSSEDAIERLADTKFDLVVLTDYRMPQKNGEELIRDIRRLQPAAPVILISGVVHALGLNEDNTGADVVIAKSNVEVQQMTRAVVKLLDRQTGKKPAKRQAPRKTIKQHSA